MVSSVIKCMNDLLIFASEYSIRKITYLNCGERYKDINDNHCSYYDDPFKSLLTFLLIFHKRLGFDRLLILS